MFEWLRRAKPRLQRTSELLLPMQQYAQEFMAASAWTAEQGLFVPPVQIVANKDCVDWTLAEPALQSLLGAYREDELAKELFAMNCRLLPHLCAAINVPLRITLGWFEHDGKSRYVHDHALLERLLKKDPTVDTSRGLPLHVWFTSPAFEIIDIALPTIMSRNGGRRELAGGILYLSNQSTEPAVIYHPTVVGEDFLYRIGAVFGIGPREQ